MLVLLLFYCLFRDMHEICCWLNFHIQWQCGKTNPLIIYSIVVAWATEWHVMSFANLNFHFVAMEFGG